MLGGVSGEGLDGMKGGGNGFFAGLGAAEVAIHFAEEIIGGGIGQRVVALVRRIAVRAFVVVVHGGAILLPKGAVTNGYRAGWVQSFADTVRGWGILSFLSGESLRQLGAAEKQVPLLRSRCFATVRNDRVLCGIEPQSFVVG